jgi:lysozyme
MNLKLLDVELRRDEGVRYGQFLDTKGIPTIGVGHNMEVSPLPEGYEQPLSDEQVNYLLNEDLQNTFSGLDMRFPWWRELDEVRQRVIANMGFNLGIGTLATFVNTINAMQTGDYVSAAAGMAASEWATQVGDRATRLIQAMNTGVMPDEPVNI